MAVQLRDSDGTVRLSGDLLATGGATGDVLTQQADGTYAPAAAAAVGDFLVAKVELSSADILALGTTPIEIIPAPGAGKMAMPLGLCASMHFLTAAYATATGLDVAPATDAGAYFIRKSNVFAATADTVYTEGSKDAGNNEFVATFDDVAFVLNTSEGTNPTGGSGTCTVSVPYVVVDLS